MRSTRSYVITIAAGLVLGLFAAGPAPDMVVGVLKRGPLDELSWFVGCWAHSPPGGATVRERWRLLPGDTLWGVSATTRGDSVVDSERMHIVARGQRIVFVAEPARQARTEFSATTISRSLAVFENAAHDFPQRVTYRAAGDSLLARVDGIVNGSLRAIDFPMVRTECTRD